MKVGYARVSTLDQNLDLQTDALKNECCKEIFEDHGFEKVLRNWLEKYLAVDGFLDKIKSMIESIRNESSSTEEDKIVTDSKKKSTGGVEDDIT